MKMLAPIALAIALLVAMVLLQKSPGPWNSVQEMFGEPKSVPHDFGLPVVAGIFGFLVGVVLFGKSDNKRR